MRLCVIKCPGGFVIRRGWFSYRWWDTPDHWRYAKSNAKVFKTAAEAIAVAETLAAAGKVVWSNCSICKSGVSE